MIDLMKKTMMVGVGLAMKTGQEMESFLKEFSEKMKLSEEDGKKFMDEMSAKYDEARADMDARIEKAVNAALEKMNLARKSEIDALAREVEALKAAQKTDA